MSTVDSPEGGVGSEGKYVYLELVSISLLRSVSVLHLLSHCINLLSTCGGLASVQEKTRSHVFVSTCACQLRLLWAATDWIFECSDSIYNSDSSCDGWTPLRYNILPGYRLQNADELQTAFYSALSG